jgi:hypothetical protein
LFYPQSKLKYSSKHPDIGSTEASINWTLGEGLHSKSHFKCHLD